MGCNCGKKGVSTQVKKVAKPQNKPAAQQTSTLKIIIRRSAY